MPRIDPARLSRILASLTKPRDGVDAVGKRNTARSAASSQKGRKDPAVLRARLQTRLSTLRKGAEDFKAVAPTILVQEILLWEFGSEIVEHASFEKAVSAIASAMLSDGTIEAAIARLVTELSRD